MRKDEDEEDGGENRGTAVCSPHRGRGQEGRLVSFGDLQRHSGDTHRAEPECSRGKTPCCPGSALSPQCCLSHIAWASCAAELPYDGLPAAMCLDSSHHSPMGGSQGLFFRAAHSSQETALRMGGEHTELLAEGSAEPIVR